MGVPRGIGITPRVAVLRLFRAGMSPAGPRLPECCDTAQFCRRLTFRKVCGAKLVCECLLAGKCYLRARIQPGGEHLRLISSTDRPAPAAGRLPGFRFRPADLV